MLNVNDWDPRFRYQQYDFRVGGRRVPAAGTQVGKVEVADGDYGDRIALELRGPAARYITIIRI